MGDRASVRQSCTAHGERCLTAIANTPPSVLSGKTDLTGLMRHGISDRITASAHCAVFIVAFLSNFLNKHLVAVTVKADKQTRGKDNIAIECVRKKSANEGSVIKGARG